MWQPEPGWQRLPSGASTATYGVWAATVGGREAVVKRLLRPQAHDPADWSDPHHPAYWRRAADVALDGLVHATPGLRALPDLGVEEDDEGVTIVSPRVPLTPVSGLFVARCLGRFAGAALGEPGWLAEGLLETRLRDVARRGGWTTLARTPVADVVDRLWAVRAERLARFAALPHVPSHGDPVPANLPGRDGSDLLAVDWSVVGRSPLGADLGYHALSAREELEPLLEAYLAGLPDGQREQGEDVAYGARVMAVYTVVTHADWALSRAAAGAGALAGKFTHPSVAPHLRAMQRLLPQLEALL